MAKVRDYFEVDFSHTVRMEAPVQLLACDGGEIQVIPRIHLDFSSKALFASFYLAHMCSPPAPTNIILPAAKFFWNEVTASEVYEYSPWLANIRAVNWSEGIKEVVRKLQREIEGGAA